MTKKTLAAVLATFALLATCAKGPAPVSPRDAVLDAMQAVYEAGTVHQELEMKVSAAGESFSFGAVADVDNDKHGRHDDGPGVAGRRDADVDGRGRRLHEVADVRGRRHRLGTIDPSKLSPEQAAQVGGFGAGTTDPAAYAGLFAGVFDVEAAGEEEIGGVPTVHYEGTID